MKQNSLIVVLAVALILFLGGLYLFSHMNENLDSSSNPAQPGTEISQPKKQPSDSPDPTATTDPKLETMPTISKDNDLETIKQELDQTKILEEDFKVE